MPLLSLPDQSQGYDAELRAVLTALSEVKITRTERLSIQEVVMLGLIHLSQDKLPLLAALIRAVELESPDPLEPVLHTNLLLQTAGLCGAPSVNQEHAREILLQFIAVIRRQPYSWIFCRVFTGTMQSMPKNLTAELFEALIPLADHFNFGVRQEACRVFAYLAPTHSLARELCERLIDDWFLQVGSIAALGLARSEVDTPKIWRLLSHFDRDPGHPHLPTQEFLLSLRGHMPEALGSMLHSDEEPDRLAVARLFIMAGEADSAVPALRNLLQSETDNMRSRAADELWNCGRWEAAAGILLERLASKEDMARLEAARLLKERSHQAQVESALADMLESENAAVRFRAADLLLKTAYHEQALLALLSLVQTGLDSPRTNAAELLRASGCSEAVLPLLLARLQTERAQLLEHRENGDTAESSKPFERQLDETVRILVRYGQLEATVPALLDLIQSRNAYMRSRAIKMLLNSPAREQAVAILTLQLQSEHDRLVAAVRLSESGYRDLATPTLGALLQSDDASTRLVASRHLVQNAEYGAAAAQARIGCIRTGDAEVRRHVMNSFWNIPLAGPYLLAELQDLPDPSGLWERALAKPPQISTAESQLLADLTSVKPEDSEATWAIRGSLLTALWWAHNPSPLKN